MSKNSGGFMGTQIGKLGPIIASLWKGRNVYRAYNPFVRDANTPKQQLNRAIFKTVAQLAAILSTAINHGYAYAADQEHNIPRALFTRDNYHFFHASSPDSVSVDYPDLILARGSMHTPHFGTPSFVSSSRIVIPFDRTLIGAATDSDLICVTVYCPDTRECVFDKSAKRSDGSAVVDVPAHWSGKKVHLWGFAMANVDQPTFLPNLNGYIYPGQCSNSTYVGTGNIG